MRYKFLISAILLSMSLQVHAQNTPPQPPEGRPHRVPPEAAFSACQAKASGATCSFIGARDHKLEGTCDTPPEEKRLACRPARPDRPHPMDEPPHR